MANDAAQHTPKTSEEEFKAYKAENPVMSRVVEGLVTTGVATEVAVGKAVEDVKGLASSAQTVSDLVANSDHPLKTAGTVATALAEGAYDAVKNAPDAIKESYLHLQAKLKEANAANGFDVSIKYGEIGAGVLGIIANPSRGEGKAVTVAVEAGVRKVEGELVDAVGSQMVDQAASTSGRHVSNYVDHAKHVARDVKSAIMHPTETLLIKTGLLDVDTVLMDIAHKPISAMVSMDIKHHGAGEAMNGALQAQKLERANALLQFAAENPAAAEQLRKANHTQLERLVMSPEADAFLGVKPLPQMLQRPLTPTEQKIEDAIKNAEFMGGAADVAAAKQRQAAREGMSSSERGLDWLKTHMTYPGGHRPSIADADRLGLAAEHSDAAAIKTLGKGVLEKIVVGKVIVGGMMYAALSDDDKEKSANAFLKAAHIHNGFDSPQFKKDHPELLERAVPVYQAMEQGILAKHKAGGHVITAEEQRQIDATMCNVAANIAAVIKKDGPSMDGKDVGKTLQNTSNAECSFSV